MSAPDELMAAARVGAYLDRRAADLARGGAPSRRHPGLIAATRAEDGGEVPLMEADIRTLLAWRDRAEDHMEKMYSLIERMMAFFPNDMEGSG